LTENANDTNANNPTRSELIEEYKEALNDCRHHDNLIWTVFSVYFALNGGLMAFIPNISSPELIRAAGVIAIAMSFSVFIHVKKSQYYYGQKSARAREIETKLGFSLHSKGRKASRLGRSAVAKAISWALATIVVIGILWAIIIYNPLLTSQLSSLAKP